MNELHWKLVKNIVHLTHIFRKNVMFNIEALCYTC